MSTSLKPVHINFSFYFLSRWLRGESWGDPPPPPLSLLFHFTSCILHQPWCLWELLAGAGQTTEQSAGLNSSAGTRTPVKNPEAQGQNQLQREVCISGGTHEEAAHRLNSVIHTHNHQDEDVQEFLRLRRWK